MCTPGSSGSGKTTFLNSVHGLHKCTYVRQYHTLRPYIPVCKIPDFDPTQLPYWNLYSQKKLEGAGGAKNASYNPDVKIGGTMAGEFVAGLSGGQRKMMAFELVRQRTSSQSDLLIVLDEPFAGVTDDFVPFITERLAEMARKHNLVLVTNDHIEVLTEMADSTITVSAIDRSKVLVEGKSHEQELVLHALAKGEAYEHNIGSRDVWFFVKTADHEPAGPPPPYTLPPASTPPPSIASTHSPSRPRPHTPPALAPRHLPSLLLLHTDPHLPGIYHVFNGALPDKLLGLVGTRVARASRCTDHRLLRGQPVPRRQLPFVLKVSAFWGSECIYPGLQKLALGPPTVSK